MMCYRDMTFCNGNNGECAAFSTCHRALTEQVWDKAEKAGIPIAQFTEPENMECYKPPTTQENDTK